MSASVPKAYPLSRERNAILASLVALAVIGWAIIVWQWASSGDDAMGLTMGMAAPAFLALWLAMMMAMMFPSAAPMILMFARIENGKVVRGQTAVPTSVFVAAYLAVWTVAGAVAYALRPRG